jgi:alkaline phosphatase D
MNIIFTSCMDAERIPSQPIWDHMADEEPDVLILLGDQIYMDWAKSKRPDEDDIHALTTNPTRLRQFGTDMYNRYKLQSEVKNFRKLIDRVVRKNPDNLLVCWDDHDFAWNNSCGLGNTQAGGVPATVKALSKLLFRQFVDTLRSGAKHYPDYPHHDDLPGQTAGERGIEDLRWRDKSGQLAIAVLDERWYKYPRGEINGQPHPLLGTDQWHDLSTLLNQKLPLTIVAGGLPMEHDYLMSHQAWAANPAKPLQEPAYPELALIEQTVKSPVIYLCGDIHSNEWLGRLHNHPHLLHVASSGAAIGRILINRIEPAYGVIHLDRALAQTGHNQLTILLKSLNRQGNIEVEFDTELRFSREVGWTSAQGGPVPQKMNDMHELRYVNVEKPNQPAALSQPLLVLSCRARMPKYRHKANQAQSLRWDEMDDIFSDDALSRNAGSGPASGAMEGVLIDAATDSVFIHRGQGYFTEQLTQALDRAHERGAKALTLFIHGFNNSFVETVDQGYALRDLYGADIEPVVFSWPAGYSRSRIDGAYDAKLARMETAPLTYSRLIEMLHALRALNAHHPHIKRVICARSFGVVALQSLLKPDPFHIVQRDHLLDGIHSIVLSAPAVHAAGHADWMATFAQLAPHLLWHVTINPQDAALQWFNALIKGNALGTETGPDLYQKAQYWDCGSQHGVHTAHNYITRQRNEHVKNLHGLLLSGQFNHAATGFKPSPHQPQLWTRA